MAKSTAKKDLSTEELEKGDWIVHKQHGVGQIKGVEKKEIAGNEKKYFRVKISSGVYWLPIKKIPDHIRAVSSKYKLNKALRAIRKLPEDLPRNYKTRNKEVDARAEGATLHAKGELIRDLHARRYIADVNLTTIDERQLTALRKQFLREMIVILDVEMDKAEQKLDKALERSIKKLREKKEKEKEKE